MTTSQEAPVLPAPKLCDAELRPLKDTFITKRPEELLYNYYSISVKPGKTPALFEFVKAPPVLAEGLVVIDRCFYGVTPDDIIRGRILASRKLAIQPRESTHSSNSTVAGRKHSKPVSVPGEYKPSTDGAFRDEVSEAADLAWEEQVETLLGTVYTKEGEWEITRTPEP